MENNSNNQQNNDEIRDEMNTGINEDVSGNDRTFEHRDDRAHHQQFGNRKYESHRNHSSNDDQPLTDTSPTGTSPTIS